MKNTLFVPIVYRAVFTFVPSERFPFTKRDTSCFIEINDSHYGPCAQPRVIEKLLKYSELMHACVADRDETITTE